jgi:hypothetical protein
MTTMTTLTTLSDPLADTPTSGCSSAPVLARLITFDGSNESVPLKPDDNECPPAAATPRDSGVFFGSADERWEQKHTGRKSPAGRVHDGAVAPPWATATATTTAPRGGPAPPDHATRERMFEVSTRSLLRSSTVVIPRDVSLSSVSPSTLPHDATPTTTSAASAAAGTLERRASLRPDSSASRPVSLSKILHDRRRGTVMREALRQAGHADGCLLARSIETGYFRATTTAGRPAFFCRVDNLVVFDGVVSTSGDDGGGTYRLATRSSKGLAVANARGGTEVVELRLDCAHCRDMLGLKVWKYAAKVCPRSVCGECRKRCVELHEEAMLLERAAVMARRAAEGEEASVVTSSSVAGEVPPGEAIVESERSEHPSSIDSINQGSGSGAD